MLLPSIPADRLRLPLNFIVGVVSQNPRHDSIQVHGSVFDTVQRLHFLCFCDAAIGEITAAIFKP